MAALEEDPLPLLKQKLLDQKFSNTRATELAQAFGEDGFTMNLEFLGKLTDKQLTKVYGMKKAEVMAFRNVFPKGI